MDSPRPLTIGEKLDDSRRIEAALQQAGREAVLDHARAGNPVCTWKDGKVVWLQPDEIFALYGVNGNGAAKPDAGS